MASTSAVLWQRHARAALDYALTASLTPKQHVLIAEPDAKLDYYESLRNADRPCWYLRRGLQGPSLTPICPSPRAAWKAGYDNLLDVLRKAAA